MIKIFKSMDRNEKKTIFFAAIFLFMVNAIFVNRLGIPYVADEMGYMGTAMYLTGKDWTGLMYYLSYYSYGYSILLVPFTFLINEPTTLYKAIIIFNNLIICASFVMVYMFLKKITNQKNSEKVKELLLASLFITASLGGFKKSNMALAEALLTLLLIVAVSIFQSYLENPKPVKIFGISALLFYSYVVHQRTIVFIIAFAMVIALMYFMKKITPKELLIFLATMFAGILVSAQIKTFVIDNIWLNGPFTGVNNFASEVEKLETLVTSSGVTRFFTVLLGHFYYFSSVTFLVGTVSFLIVLVNVINNFYLLFKNRKTKEIKKEESETDENKNKENKEIRKEEIRKEEVKINYLYMFVLLCFLGIVAVSVLFTRSNGRYDAYFYARYMEIGFAPILCIGISEILKNKDKLLKYFVPSILVYVIIGVILQNAELTSGMANFSYMNSNFMYVFFNNGEFYLYLCTAIVAAVGLILFLTIKFDKLKIMNGVLFSASAGVILISIYCFNKIIVPVGEANMSKNIRLSEIRKDDDIDKVYFLGYGIPSKGTFSQFLLYDKPLIGMGANIRFDVNSFTGNHYLLSEQLSKRITDNYDCDDYINGVYFLSKLDEKNENNIYSVAASSLNTSYSFKERLAGGLQEVSDGTQGIVTATPPMALEKGVYSISFELELPDDAATLKKTDELKDKGYDTQTEHIGAIVAQSTNPEIEYGVIQLYRQMFAETENNTLSIVFDVNVDTYNYEFYAMVIAQEGVILKANSFSVQPK